MDKMNKNKFFNLEIPYLILYNLIFYFLTVFVDYLKLEEIAWPFINTLSYGVRGFYLIFLCLIFYLVLIKLSGNKFKFEYKEWFRIWLMTIFFLEIFLGFLRDTLFRYIDTYFFVNFEYIYIVVTLLTSFILYFYTLYISFYLGTKYFSKKYNVDWKYVLGLMIVLIIILEFVISSLISPHIYEFLYSYLGVSP